MTLDSGILIATIGVVGSAATAAISYTLTKRLEFQAHRRELKINHYKVLLAAISDLAVDSTDADAHRRFALAVNTIALVAPQRVVASVLAFHDGTRASSSDQNIACHDQLLTRLMLDIRTDLKIRPKDHGASFEYRLVGAAPTVNQGETGNRR